MSDDTTTLQRIGHHKKEAFLEAFAVCGTVHGAAKSSGIVKKTADADDYRAAFAEAMAD